MRVLGKILYWLAVLVVSVGLLVLVIRWLDSRDPGGLESGAAAPASLANTTMRSFAL